MPPSHSKGNLNYMVRGYFVDYSGSITTGGTAQQVLPQDDGRRYLLFVNTSDTQMEIDFGRAATATSIPVPAGATREFALGVPLDYLSVLCATTGKTFVCKVLH